MGFKLFLAIRSECSLNEYKTIHIMAPCDCGCKDFMEVVPRKKQSICPLFFSSKPLAYCLRPSLGDLLWQAHQSGWLLSTQPRSTKQTIFFPFPLVSQISPTPSLPSTSLSHSHHPPSLHHAKALFDPSLLISLSGARPL